MSLEKTRIKFQEDLEAILGSRNVYFQPSSSITLKYPCIIYACEDLNELHANDVTYINRQRYTVTLLTKDPLPEETLMKLREYPYSSFDRHYSSDNIHHFAYTVHVLERT